MGEVGGYSSRHDENSEVVARSLRRGGREREVAHVAEDGTRRGAACRAQVHRPDVRGFLKAEW